MAGFCERGKESSSYIKCKYSLVMKDSFLVGIATGYILDSPGSIPYHLDWVKGPASLHPMNK
jgi:hypothetical protein